MHRTGRDDAGTGRTVDASQQQRIRAARARLQKIAYWLDGCIQLPGTRWRIGLEPVIGLVPVAGDVVGFLLSTLIIVEGIKLGVPAGLVARMLGVMLLDLLSGLVPVLGDLFDFAYKANRRNAQLLTQHLDKVEGRLPRRSVLRQSLYFAMLVAVAVVPGWALYRLLQSLGAG